MQTLTKNKIKLINSLKSKKYRYKERLFICEGEKIIKTLINSNFKIVEIFATREFADNNNLSDFNFTIVSDIELKKISELSSPQKVLALVKIPKKNIENVNFSDKLTLILDKIQDPGNLGTIIRIADWFGIQNIVCSTDTVDVYNPKVVMSTMGSVFSINIYYTELSDFLTTHSKSNIYGTFTDGKNIYKTTLPKTGFIIMGNEANGISTEVEKFITHKLAIPSFNKSKTAESLNVAVATAIICSEFMKI